MQQSAWRKENSNNRTRFSEPIEIGKKPDNHKRTRRVPSGDMENFVNEEDATIEIRCLCGTLKGREFTGCSCNLCETVVKPRYVVFGNRVVPQKYILSSKSATTDPTDFVNPTDAESESKDASMSQESTNDERTGNSEERAKVVVHVHNGKPNQPSKVGLCIAAGALLTCVTILGAAWYLKR